MRLRLVDTSPGSHFPFPSTGAVAVVHDAGAVGAVAVA